MNSKEVSVSDLVPTSSANIDGVFVGALSPIKTSRNDGRTKYFNTQFSDGTETVRFVSFEPKLWSKIDDARANYAAVSIKNCCVKRGKQNDLEVLATSHTTIQNSPKKFKVDHKDVQEHNAECRNIQSLQQLSDIADHQYITVSGKITTLYPVEKITIKATGKQLSKADFLLADKTAVFRCVAWEEHLHALQQDNTYSITNATLRSYNGEKYVSIGQNSTIAQVDDMLHVIDDEAPTVSIPRSKVIKGELVNVITTDTYKSCHNCNIKVSTLDSNALITTCNNCNSKMKTSKCATRTVANVILEDDHNTSYKVSIFDDVIKQLNVYSTQNSSTDLAVQLLSTPVLTYTISPKDVVSSVTNSL